MLRRKSQWPLLYCGIAGALLALAFAPLRLYLFAIISPAYLLYTWLKSSPRDAFKQGFCFGLGFYGTGISWLVVCIHLYGQAPLFLAIILTFCGIAAFSLYPALQGYGLRRFFPQANFASLILIYPASWILCEWLRSTLFTGFPWLLLGTSQTNSSLAGFAPLIGTYGITGLLTALSVVLVLFFRLNPSRMLFCIIGIALFWASGTYLRTQNWTLPFGNPLSVSLIQGNIDSGADFSTEFLMENLQTYRELTAKAWGSDIIVWPENAILTPLQSVPNFLQEMSKEAKEHRSALVLGIPEQTPDGKGYYNAAIALGNGQGQYRKRNLVPFGEYIPWRNSLSRLEKWFSLPPEDTLPGDKDQHDLIVNGVFLAPFICYEIAFSETVRADLPNANILATLSNDLWFGHSFALGQHLQIAQMRAIETGRYLLMSSNNGITGIINPKGKLITQIPPFQQAIAKGTIEAMTGETPWVKFGDKPIFLIALLVLLISGLVELVRPRPWLEPIRND